MDLTELRKEIDGIDQQIIRLFLERMEIASEIAYYKKVHGLAVRMPLREQQKLAEIAAMATPGMENYTTNLYEKIFELSRNYQEFCSKPLTFGLLGRKISYSYSPFIHNLLGKYNYQLFEKEPYALEDFLRNGDFSGINVTIPYKKSVVPYCAELSPIAKKLGAVNTIVRRTDGSLFGHNTDYWGFSHLLKRSGLHVSGKRCLILGSGGASNTVCAVLEENGADTVVISRTGINSYNNLSLYEDAFLIVNATPVGTYPDVGISPISLDNFPKLMGVIDLIYNPSKTKLLMDAEKRGIVALNGLEMLVAQAKESAELFTGKSISDDTLAQTLSAVQVHMRNLILIGMPGCGKTTLGKALEKLLPDHTLVDTDDLIEKRAGIPIFEFLSRYGEHKFRALETEILKSVGKESGQIITTGGGCVTRAENYSFLHQNGVIVWIQRDLDALPTSGRPLSKKSSLTNLYVTREPMYRRFSDLTVYNENTPEDTAKEIIKQFTLWFQEDAN